MPLPSQRSIRSVILLAVATIVALVVSVAFLIFQLRQRELNHARLETISLVQMLIQETQQTLDNTDQVLMAVQERLSSPDGRQFKLDSAATQELLSERVSGQALLDTLFVVDAQGRLVSSSRAMEAMPQSLADREYYRVFAERDAPHFLIGVPVIGKRSKQWTIHVARPLRGPDGAFRGVIVAAIRIPRFEQLYDIVKLDYVRPMALYMTDGTLIAGLPRREALIGSHAPELTGVRLPQLEGAVDALPRRNGDGGQELFAFGRLVKYPLLVSVTDDEVQSLASWRETSMPIAFGATLIIGFIVLVALFLIRRLSLQEGLARALQLATERYQHTVDSVMDAIVAVDASMKVVLFNTAAERMFGRPAAQVIGEPLDMLLPQRLRSVHRRHIDRFGASATAAVTMDQQFDAVGLRADGSEFPFESSVSRTVFDGAMQMTAVLRDVTAHRLAETELRKANQQLRNLSASLQLVREEERTRISRELHDELGQQLTGLKLHLSWVGSRLKEGRAAAIEMIDDMRPLLDTAIASVRRISTELRPPILDDLGFSDAVTWHADEVSRRSGLKIVLDLDRAVPVMDVERTTALFRIVQESLTNVLRHARATKVEIALRIESDELALSISDDGMGFDRDVGKSGIGLVSMRERATAIGARFDIVDATGKGTTIRVRMPLDDVFRSGDKT